MKNLLRRQIALLLMLSFTVITAQVAQAAVIDPQIENFAKVDDRLYRGAQPDEAAIAALAKLGVKTVVNFRHDPKGYERAAVEAAGMRYIHMPMRSANPPSDEEINKFLQLFNDKNDGPVYVHCKLGRHRTGVMTALYRMKYNQWNFDQSYTEMLKFDFEKGGNPSRWKKFLNSYYAVKFQQAPAD